MCTPLHDVGAAALQELVAAGFARDRILCVPGDVSREASMVQAAQLTVEKFGALHAVINSAGLSLAQVFETSTEQQVQVPAASNMDTCCLGGGGAR